MGILRTYTRFFKWLLLALVVSVAAVGGGIVGVKLFSTRIVTWTEKPITVKKDQELAQETYNRIVQPPTLSQKITSVSVTPRSRSISTVPLDSIKLKTLPFGVVTGEKRGRVLSLSTLNFHTGEVVKDEFELSDKGKDFSFRAGTTPASVRQGRSFGLRIGGSAEVQLPLLSASDSDSLGFGVGNPALSFTGGIYPYRNDLSLRPWLRYELGRSVVVGIVLRQEF